MAAVAEEKNKRDCSLSVWAVAVGPAGKWVEHLILFDLNYTFFEFFLHFSYIVSNGRPK